MTTVRELINGLIEATTHYDMDPDTTEVRFAVAEGEDMHILNHVDMDVWTQVRTGADEQSGAFVLLRGHLDSGNPIRVRGVAADADEYLRRWTDDPEE
jgi:hypothetical protein